MGSSSFIASVLIGAVCMTAPSLGFGQADLRMTGSVTGTVVTQTRPQTLAFIATNLGPATATNVVATSPFAISQADLSVTATCPITLTGPSTSQIVAWPIGAMSPGEQRNCSITLRALPTSAASATIFGLRLTGDQPDPGSLNNSFGTLFTVSSYDAVSDLSIAVAAVPSVGLLPTDGTGRLYVTLSNLGPQAAATAQAVSDHYASPFQNTHQFLIFDVPEDPCIAQINVELSTTRVITGPLTGLAPGASITCVLGIERRPGAMGGTYVLGWTTFLAGFGSDDPNSTNNQTNVLLGISDPPIPVPLLSPLSILLLVAGVVVTAMVSRGLRKPG